MGLQRVARKVENKVVLFEIRKCRKKAIDWNRQFEC